MRTRSTFSFETATLEGSLFVPDRLERFAQGALDAELPLRLPAGLTPSDEIGRSFRIAAALWKDFSRRRAQQNHRVVTRDFLSKFFRDALGYDLGDPAGIAGAVPSAPSPDGEAPPSPIPFRLTAPGRFPVFFASHREGLDHADRFFSGGSLAPRKRTVTAFAQEFLNAEESSLWAVVSDGLRIRLLRDNALLTRPCWLEFDLERILSEERYPDFAVLWRVLYHSRVGPTPDAKSSDWETLRKTGIEEGVRVRDKLRDGIASALERLGTGFLRAPGSAALRQALETGALTVEGYRRELLRLAYRLLFLFVAEERDLLHAPEADASSRRRYAAGYSLRRLTRRSRRVSAADASFFDLWDSLRIVFRLLGGASSPSEPSSAAQPHPSFPPQADPSFAAAGRIVIAGEAGSSFSSGNPLGLPELGGLFSPDRCPFLDAASLDNASLLGAVRDLRWTIQGGAAQAVDYRNMGAEEFGSIYESLLEMVPSVSLPRREFTFAGPAAGNARKTSASYYTPAPLVDRLVRSALDPLIEKALSAKDPEAALLALAVLDPACGSGHFSLAAGRRIAEALARVRAGEGGTVTPALYRAAFRDVISHCLYGVDLNPMAVELAKIALWIESVEPGKPLTFLDAHFVCGNSVLGVMDLKTLPAGIPAAAYDALDGDDKELCKALKKKNAAAIKAVRGDALYHGGVFAAAGAGLSARFAEIDTMPERTVADVAAKRAAHEAFLREAATGPAATAADLLLAAFLLPKPAAESSDGEAPSGVAGSPDGEAPSSPICPTSHDLFGALGLPGFTPPSEALVAACRAACRSAGVLHWPLVFPAVFARGGFDCALANPPWDQLQFAEKEFFSVERPDFLHMNSSQRKNAISALSQSDPILWTKYKKGLCEVEKLTSFISSAPHFSLSAHGKLNLYSLFTDLIRQMISEQGTAGFIVKLGICTDDSTKKLFEHLVKTGQLQSLYGFENEEKVFPGVHHDEKFCLITLGHCAFSQFSFFLRSAPAMDEPRRRFSLTADDFSLINPNTLTCPIFRSKYDAELTKKVYRRTGILWHETPLVEQEAASEAQTPFVANPWGIRFWTMFNMATDSSLFCIEPGEGRIPLYEGKIIGLFDHRFASFDHPGEEDYHDCTSEEKQNPTYEPSPRYWVDKSEVISVLESFDPDKPTPRYLMGWRDITQATNFRTTIASVVPLAAAGDTLLLLKTQQKPSLNACLLADFNSLVRDYIARQKVAGKHLKFFTMKQLATLPPSAYTQADIDYIVPRVLELTYTSHSLKPWAEDLDYHGEPFRWDENRRAILRAELDARYARLYGLTRDELRYILDPADLLGPDYPSETFRVLKEKELAAFGEYRTRRLTLAAWDRATAVARQRNARGRSNRTHYLGPLVMELISATGSDRIALDKLVTAWAALSEPELIAASRGMPEATAAWAAAYPDAIHPDERLETTLLNMIDRHEISVERDGTVIRLENEDVADDEIRMDAAIAISYTNLVESMPIPREGGFSAIPAVAVLSSTFISSMKSGAFHREAA